MYVESLDSWSLTESGGPGLVTKSLAAYDVSQVESGGRRLSGWCLAAPEASDRSGGPEMSGGVLRPGRNKVVSCSSLCQATQEVSGSVRRLRRC